MTDYEKYQLKWMIEHGYFIEDLIRKLAKRVNGCGLDLYCEYLDWEQEVGFEESEIWSCKDEWENNEKQEHIKLSALDIYKELKINDRYEVGCKLQCYVSISSFVNNPTDEEYEIIANKCYEVYLKMEEGDLVNLCDGVSERYSNGQFTLDELKQMDKWKIMEFYNWS